MIKTKTIIAIMIISIPLIFIACVNNPEEITIDQAVFIVRPYFQELYEKRVVVEKISYEKISEHEYRNIITVSDEDENEYTLYLDYKNKPLFDDVSTVDLIKSIDITSFVEIMNSLGMETPDDSFSDYGLRASFSYEKKRSFVSLSANLIDRLNKNIADDVYSFLLTLNNKGIDELSIIISAPDFLRPKIELGHGTLKLNIYGVTLSTNIEREIFEEKYYEFVDGVYWDEQKFSSKIFELTQLGYENVYFFISRWNDGNTLEIVLYCESDTGLSDEQSAVLLKDIDDSYIKIDKADTIFVLQHKIK